MVRIGVVLAALSMPVVVSLSVPATALAQQGPVYKLPIRGAPASRVGGGTRGISISKPSVTVLAPDHTGLTMNPQPTLYWHLSKPATGQVEVTVVDDASAQPLVRKVIDTPLAAGIQSVSLKDVGATLKPGVDYRWHVALVVDPGMRSNDVVSSGAIRLVPAPAALDGKLRGGQRDAPNVYAAEGLWYDSIDALMRLISASPEDKQLRSDLDSLLGQVGLKQVARQF